MHILTNTQFRLTTASRLNLPHSHIIKTQATGERTTYKFQAYWSVFFVEQATC